MSSNEVIAALSGHVVPFPSPLPPEQEDELLSRMVPGRAEVVLLGESTHGSEDFYRYRRLLTKHLVRDRGFRAVLLEAEWPDIYNVNLHLTKAKSPYQSVAAALAQIRGHGKHMWQNHETIALLEWIKAFNESQQYRPDSIVYVFGIDCQQIYRSLNVLYVALAEVDFALCQELKGRLSFFNGHSEDEHEYARKTVGGIGSENISEILQQILSEFQWKHFDRLKAKLPPDRMLDILNIEQNLEVLVNAEEYFKKMVLEPAGSNVSWNTRDQHMALTVSRIHERLGLVFSTNQEEVTTKVVCWAHNSHIGNSAATARGGADFTRNETWNLGQMVHQVTDRSFLLGFDTFEGTVTALANGNDSTKTYNLRPAIEGSIEHLCHRVCESLPCSAFLLPLETEGMSGQLREALSSRVHQRYVGVHYRPDTEMRSHYNEAGLIGQFDALVFIDKTSALRVLKPEELQAVARVPADSKKGAKSNKFGVRRLMQEYVRLRKHPIPHIRIAAEEDDLYKCHFLLTFDSGVYAGGEYHGLLNLPQDYPMAPPRISFFTPSGRFETGERVCVSFSDYHPELWNPSWGIESVLVGLQSFMQEECPEALGSTISSAAKRRKLSSESHVFNMKDECYQQLFANENKEKAWEGGSEEKKDEEDSRSCRYCRVPGGELVSPCDCKGSNEWVHLECLAKWQYQAILSQNTHPKYQTGLEKICNVCQREFRIKQYEREKLMISFTGAEMANMIARGCVLVATERSSRRNVQLMEQYEYLRDKLQHWTKGVFLITECMTSRDGKKQSIIGLGLTNEMDDFEAKRRVQALSKLGLQEGTRQFIGGPVSPEDAYVLFAVQASKVNSNRSPDYCWSVLPNADDGDVSVWFVSLHHYVSRALSWAGDALIEARVYWGCACWDRVQLLGEIARGGWGVATGQPDSWSQPIELCWQSCLERAIFAGSNDFSKFDEDD
uniref:UBC core domain-containing protein n=1 Tax=Odontella aurita TaxID=265563 RepID=A0A7S4K280_9STRA|mmetsp:Transcript_59941/g.177734  ORF Transcript_59941/g.177734 Transcript_59941/m.177734 type:complete len:952 (+) Transcript_59941:254-3109(+)